MLIVGAFVGFVACYVWLGGARPEQPGVDSRGAQGTPPGPGQQAGALEGATPSELATAPGESPTAPAAETPVDPAAELAALEDVWPARHLFIAVKGLKLDAGEKAMLAELKPGGVVIRKENVQDKPQTIALIKEIKEAVGLGASIDSLPLIAVDQEGGPVNRLRLIEAPPPRALGSGRDPEEARRIGRSVAASCIDRGIGVLLAPSLDVYSQGGLEAMKDRSFGEDHALVATIGLAFADAALNAGVVTVVKHFPGIGAAKENTDKTLAVMPATRPLAEIVYPFDEASRAEVPGILVGHIAVPELDREAPNRPASLSPVLVKNLLRDRWSYPGVILADDLNKGAITSTTPVEDAAVSALQAGCDAVLMLEPDVEKIRLVCATIEKAATEGALDRRQLSESKKRLDSWQKILTNPGASSLKTMPGVAGQQVAGRVPMGTQATSVSETGTQVSAAEAVVYEVVRGDGLQKIASKFDVTQDDIKTWNKLANSNIRVGQKLTIYPGLKGQPAPTPAPVEATAPASPVPEEQSVAPSAPGPTETTVVGPAPGEPPVAEPPSEEPSVEPPANSKPLTHVVKGGEFLASIATRYGVNYQDIMKWNDLNDTKLSVGQQLIIYVAADFVLPESAAPAEATEQPAQPEQPAESPAADRATPQVETAVPDAANAVPPPMEIQYVVKAGDTLAKIGGVYGVTVDELKEWNSLPDDRLLVGKTLVVRPKKMPAQN
jgi:beta-N-acetylhexosaminidase